MHFAFKEAEQWYFWDRDVIVKDADHKIYIEH